jgi:hypothetical protein
MTHKLFSAAAAVLALSLSAGASAALPVASLGAAPTVAVTKVTFWGKPFPYGYRWARSCSRYEMVETSRGPVMQRVWTCGRGGVVSYKG